MSKRNVLLLFVLLLSCTVLTGCGETDVRQYHVKGTVTFQGTPVPAGSIQFIPSGGNSGPPGYADIINGHFDTSIRGSKGTVGGTHTVIIQGFDGMTNRKAELPQGLPLFQDFKVQYDVPKQSESTRDFQVTVNRYGGV